MFVQELSDDSLNQKRGACGRMLQEFWTVSKRYKVIFIDECAIYQSSRSQNIVFFFKRNPLYREEVEHHPARVMVWGAMNNKHLFGPYFFDGSVNHLNLLAMLENWFIPQLQSLGIESNVWFQQDGAPAHFAIPVWEYLSETFPSLGLAVNLPPCQLHLTGRLEILT